MESNEELLRKYLETLRLRNLSEHTLSAYSRDLQDFFDYCDDNDLELRNLDASDFRSMIGHRVTVDNLSATTVRRNVSAIRQFMQWATFNGYLEQDNSEDVNIKVRATPLPHTLEIDTIIQMLDQPAPTDPTQAELWIRDKAIMELFYSTGMRLSELHDLNIGAINHNSLLVRVVGKGNKERIIPFGRKAREAIFDWLPIYQKWVKIEPNHKMPLFVSLQGSRLSKSQIERRIIVQARRVGIESNIHPHLFRHSFATHMLSNAGDIRAVQEMLGHVSLSTTQIYTHLDFDSLARSYDQAHPRANKK